MSEPVREPALRRAVMALEEEDRALRGRSAADGRRIEFSGHPCLEDLHRSHGARLRALVAEFGWPGRSLVGVDGAEAAWRLVQNAIEDPDLQREALGWLREAAAAGESPAWQPALLEDRIRVLEGRPQRYGTQWGFDEAGVPAVFGIEEDAEVDARRARVGLGSLAEERARLVAAPDPAPAERAGWPTGFTAWARRAGWRA